MRSAMAEPRQPPNEVDTTDQSWIISGEFKQPELVLFADPYEEHSRVLVLKVRKKLVHCILGHCLIGNCHLGLYSQRILEFFLELHLSLRKILI